MTELDPTTVEFTSENFGKKSRYQFTQKLQPVVNSLVWFRGPRPLDVHVVATLIFREEWAKKSKFKIKWRNGSDGRALA